MPPSGADLLVKLNKIYTRTGDDGTSGLVDGTRRDKADALFSAIGDVDEANSAIGVAIAQGLAPHITALLRQVQNDLFDLGADLATPGEVTGALRIAPGQVAWVEGVIDRINADLSPLNSFILPGGSPGAAALHLARAVARRAERSALAAAAKGPVSGQAIIYLNRLSDLLFVLARAAQDAGGDILWRPGGGQSAGDQGPGGQG